MKVFFSSHHCFLFLDAPKKPNFVIVMNNKAKIISLFYRKQLNLNNSNKFHVSFIYQATTRSNNEMGKVFSLI